MLADLGYKGFFEEVARVIHKRSVEFSSKIIGSLKFNQSAGSWNGHLHG